MKKIFTLLVALMAVVAVNATKAVFDFTKPADMGLTAPEASAATNITAPVTVDGVTMTATDGSTATRIWNSNGKLDLRVYNGGSLTFTAEEDITAVEFEGSAFAFSELTGKSWTGNAKSVAFSATGTSKITKITVTVGEAAVVWTPDTVSVTEAIALADAKDAHDHYVVGVVMGQPFITYADFGGKVSFWMADLSVATDTIEFYDGLGKDKAKWASLAEAEETLRIGDTVLVYAGGVSLYEAKNFYEVTGGYYVETIGKNPNPPVIAGPDTISVAKALEIANALAEPAANSSSTTDTKEYIVTGYAVKVYDKNSDGTWTFNMADEIGAYGEFFASNTTTDKDVVENDLMFVRGKITKFKTSKGKIQLQIYKGTGTHGEQAELDTIGAAEAKTRVEALPVDGKERVAVLAYIAKIKTAYSAENGNITVWLNDDPTSTYGDIQAYRAKCSAEVGPALAEHDKVLVVGVLAHTQYESGGEMKDSYQIAQGAELTLIEKAQGIEEILLTEKINKVVVDGVLYIVRDGKLYNVQGVQVR